MKKLQITVLIVFCIGIYFLNTETTHSQTSKKYGQYMYISDIAVHNDSYLYISVPEKFSFNVHGCKDVSYARSMNPINDDRTKAIMGIALTSFLGKKGIIVFTSGCVGPENKGYPIVEGLALSQQ
jgi:hypothetical protein